jgi:serine/threonine protein kinase
MSQPVPPAQPIICPACRQLNSPRARFCTHCGHDVILNNSGPRYFLTRVVKAGGQGAVFEAVGEDGAVYAVKEMLDNFTDPLDRAAAVARFAAEAATLRQLAHPRIPRVYGSFNDEGRHYLVMEFVRGEDLDELVAREGAQPEARVLEWADELCDVLGFLHDQGVIYRDMKPSNVMLEQPGGTIKLIDFGIAKLFQPTERGTQIGTPGYAPPEQYQGLATRLSDIYAIGATLHHLLSGRDPQLHPRI